MAISDILRFAPNRRSRGFTLMESLIALAVASILVTAAVPALQDFIIRNRMSTEVNTFTASLYLARSEAVKRVQNVKICPTTDYQQCTGGTIWGGTDSQDAHIGWMVFQDVNDNAVVDIDTDTLLQQNPPLPPRFQIIGDAGRPDAVFQATGQAGGSNNTFVFCDTANVANTRKVYLSSEGRVRVDKLASTDCSVAANGDGGTGGGGGHGH
jgi:type IV fimbrial biogenesis protein FimT